MKGLELNFIYKSIQPENSLEIYNDRNRIQRVLVNFISNAIKFTYEGKIDIILEEQTENFPP